MWPCTAEPQHSPLPCHTPSSSPVDCRVACTLSRCRTEAPVCTHLHGIQVSTGVSLSVKAGKRCECVIKKKKHCLIKYNEMLTQ